MSSYFRDTTLGKKQPSEYNLYLEQIQEQSASFLKLLFFGEFVK